MSSTPGAAHHHAWSPATFVGRETELAVLRAALDQARGGYGQVVLVSGEPGSGKSSIAVECVSAAASAGFRSLWGYCHEWEGSPAYWPWLQILRRYMDDLDDDRLVALLGRGRDTLSQLLPEITDRLPSLPVVPQAAGESRFAIFEDVTSVIRRAAETQPLALALDDLHWADRSSLLLLEFITHEIRDAPVLIVGTYRSTETRRQSTLSGSLAELSRQPHVRQVALRGLSDGETERLIALSMRRTPPSALVATVQERTEGNPFYIVEVSRMLASDGDVAGQDSVRGIPESVRAVITRRLERLPVECVETLAVASVIGRDFTLPVLSQSRGLAAEEVIVHLSDAIDANVVAEQDVPGHYRFVHVLIHDTLYDRLSGARRTRLHQTVGEALERLYAANVEPQLPALAFHFFQSAALDGAMRAIDYAMRAGEQARRQLAWESAVEHYQRAAALIDLYQPDNGAATCDALLGMGAAQWHCPDPDAARETYWAAAGIARRIGSPERLARAALGAAGTDVMGAFNPDRRLLVLLEDALAALPETERELRVRLLCQLAYTVFEGDDLVERRLRLTGDALAIARSLGDSAALLQALDAHWYALQGPDNVRERVAVATEQLQVARQSSDMYAAMLAHAGLAADAWEMCDTTSYIREIAEYRRIAIDLRRIWHEFGGHYCLIIPPLIDGRLEDTERALADMQPALLAAIPEAIAPRMIARFHIMLGREQDRPGDAAAYAEPFAVAGVVDEPLYWETEYAILLHDLGQRDEARRVLDRLATRDFRDLVKDGQWLDALARLSELAALLGDREGAATLYDLLAPYPFHNATRFLHWISHGSVSHYLGLLATTLERWDAAARHFEDALAMHERMQARLFVVWTQVAYAGMLLRRRAAGDLNRAGELARSALATSEELGLARMAREATTLLRELPNAGPRTPHGLSPRELEVLRLIVDGRTDREIADALFISHRTVMRHVSNILDKLGLDSRTAAAAHAVREGIV